MLYSTYPISILENRSLCDKLCNVPYKTIKKNPKKKSFTKLLRRPHIEIGFLPLWNVLQQRITNRTTKRHHISNRCQQHMQFALRKFLIKW